MNMFLTHIELFLHMQLQNYVSTWVQKKKKNVLDGHFDNFLKMTNYMIHVLLKTICGIKASSLNKHKKLVERKMMKFSENKSNIKKTLRLYLVFFFLLKK